MTSIKISIAILCLFLSSFAYSGQSSINDDWQTFETNHFRIHYRPEYKDWALSGAIELENIRTLIKNQQNRSLDKKIDVYVKDPFNLPNGFAIPLNSKPYMTLYATPPLSDGVLSNYGNWQQLLILHEYVHLIHLAQKNRANWRNTLGNWWDLYNASQIPGGERWVDEGYATLLESKLTGRGRLFHDGIEATLSQFAREGALPSFSELSSSNDKYLSASMAYLIGSRFLMWLEENYSRADLDAVWTRRNAVKKRNFDQAFQGVFLSSAEVLYQKFIAEYTFKTLLKDMKYSDRKSQLWLDLTGKVDAPSLSPNGQLLALVEQDENKKSKLTIYSTEDNLTARDNFHDKALLLLKEDPQDIPDREPGLFKREKKYTLNQQVFKRTPSAQAHVKIQNPNWLNNDIVIYISSTIDKKGQFHQDLFQWHIRTNKVKKLTRHANIRRFDISPSGRFIIAEQSRFGYSQLIKLSINGKVINEITTKSMYDVYDFPKISPDASLIAYLQSSANETWSLKVKSLSSDHIQIIPAPTGYQYLSYPQWSKDAKSIYFVAGVKGELKLYQYVLYSQKLFSLTSGKHPISWPILQDDNTLLHLSVNAQGPDIYQLNLAKTNKTRIIQFTKSAKVRLQSSSHLLIKDPPHKNNTLPEKSKEYGIGKQQGTFILGGNISTASQDLLEIGYKSGDVLHKLDWQINASQDVTHNTISGNSFNLRWQSWPIKLQAHSYQLKSKLRFKKESGAFLQARLPYNYRNLSFNTQFQLKYEDMDLIDNQQLRNKYGSFGFDQAWYYETQNWGIKQQSQISWLQGQFNNENWHGNDGRIELKGHFNKFKLGTSYAWLSRSGDDKLLSLGGYPSNLILKQAHPNKILLPELAFNYDVGNKYHKYEIFYPMQYGQVFFAHHKLSPYNKIKIYGLKGQLKVAPLFTGITDLLLDLGISQVNPENKPSDIQLWMGLMYLW